LLALANLATAFLQGCQSASTPWAGDPLKPHVDPSVMSECGDLVDVPHRFVPADEASRLWAQDRSNFGDCRRLKHSNRATIRALVK
ncbi:hypothetical protein, partial [Mesorhizobium sp. M2D.F.Ca.ET.226.01.1.1]|uniref:hypothetical protein n=1 Tax=Mesorhizobium sp. M2D.F.Ca.ET.226.01.1.1 TaxID=2496668 RepID=UPI001AEDDE93